MTTSLTPRELQIMHEMATTSDTGEVIARRLGCSYQTLKNHLSNVYVKLGTDGIRGAFIAMGWLRV